MKNLLEYDYLVNDIFYKCQPILKYIEDNPNMSNLDFEALESTIMDALVYKKLINPKKQSLNLNKLCIVDNLEYYQYEKHPNVCGIPQWIKEEFRKKSLYITGGEPISIFLAKPSSKVARFCVYDPNTAVSSIFEDATFYQVFYNSPTRNKRIEDKRPFVEVNIEGELYLVDVLTKRIFKSSYFKENYGFEIISQKSISNFTKEEMKYYKEHIAESRDGLSIIIPFVLAMKENPYFAEMIYELEKSKQYFQEEWKKYEYENEILNDMKKEFPILKKKKDNCV